MRKVLLTLFGLLCIGLFALMPNLPNMAYPSTPLPPVTPEIPITTPSSPTIVCEGRGTFRVDFVSCDGVYLWWQNRPAYITDDEVFSYAVTWDRTVLSSMEFLTYANQGELFYADLDRDYMAGRVWSIDGWYIDNEFQQWVCTTENNMQIDCTNVVPKSRIRIPMIFKAIWLEP